MRNMLTIVILIVLLSFTSTARGDALEDAFTAYDDNNFAAALPAFEQLAGQGSAEAAYMAGLMHHRGRGTPADGQKALKWYGIAADQNLPIALTNAGIVYRDGAPGVTTDPAKAADFFRRGAYLDDAEGQLAYGGLFWSGLAEKKDEAEAMAWWMLAAENGSEGGKKNINALTSQLSSEVMTTARNRAKEYRTTIDKIVAMDRQQRGVVDEIRNGEGAENFTDVEGVQDVQDVVKDMPAPPPVNQENVPQNVGPANVSPYGGQNVPAPGTQDGQPIRQNQPAPPAGPGAQGGMGASKTVALVRQEVRDPGMGNIVSHTMLVPKDWAVQGGVLWRPGAKPFVNLYMSIAAPDGRSVTMIPTIFYSHVEPSAALAQAMAQNGFRAPEPNAPQIDGTLFTSPPQDVPSHVLRDILPNLRPTAQNARVLSVKPMPEYEKAYNDMLAPFQQMDRNIAAMQAQVGIHSNRSLSVRLVRIGYTEGGVAMEEDFAVALAIDISRITDAMTGQVSMVNAGWMSNPIASARAPAGQLDANESLLTTVIASIRPSGQWQMAINQLQNESAKIEREGFAQRQKIISQTSKEIFEMNKETWDKQQASNDRMHRTFTNTITETEDYANPDGTQVNLPYDYKHVHTDGLGNYVLTDDPDFNATKYDLNGDYQEIHPVRRSP